MAGYDLKSCRKNGLSDVNDSLHSMEALNETQCYSTELLKINFFRSLPNGEVFNVNISKWDFMSETRVGRKFKTPSLLTVL